MSLKDKIKTKENEEREIKSFGSPIMFWSSGVRNPNCKFYAIHKRYKTEYCQRPEHIKIQAEAQGGRGIIHGCEDCTLSGGEGVKFE